MYRVAKIIFIAALFAASSAHAAYEAQCRADSEVRNQGFGGHVNSILFVKLDRSESVGIEAALSLLGHVGIGQSDENDPLRIGYYSVFNVERALSSRAPRARKYKDEDYFRFTELRDSLDNRFDGGGMNGYFVISRKIKDVDYGETVDAHFVVQSGDHFGGTIDYTCTKEY
jgi:hypothetical protein